MKPDKLLLELEILLEKSGYRLRKERGSFRGDECVIEGEKLVIINKGKPPEAQIGTIARILSELDMEDVYIKPAIKKELEILWDKFSVPGSSDPSDLEFED